jgi:hypothetical protein
MKTVDGSNLKESRSCEALVRICRHHDCCGYTYLETTMRAHSDECHLLEVSTTPHTFYGRERKGQQHGQLPR